jgi:2-pyrone-4,6-dicarboxylate lactonase
MGRPDVSKPVDGPEFALFLKFMREHPNTDCKPNGSSILCADQEPHQHAYLCSLENTNYIAVCKPDRPAYGIPDRKPNDQPHHRTDVPANRHTHCSPQC